MAFKPPTYNLPFPEKRNKIGEKIYLIGGGQKKNSFVNFPNKTNKQGKKRGFLIIGCSLFP